MNDTQTTARILAHHASSALSVARWGMILRAAACAATIPRSLAREDALMLSSAPVESAWGKVLASAAGDLAGLKAPNAAELAAVPGETPDMVLNRWATGDTAQVHPDLPYDNNGADRDYAGHR